MRFFHKNAEKHRHVGLGLKRHNSPPFLPPAVHPLPGCTSITFRGAGEWWVLTKVTVGVTKVTSFFKWIWRLVIFLWMKKKFCSQCCREAQSSPSSEDITCSYSQQHIAFVAIFISLKKKGAMDHPLAPWLLRLSCPQSRRVWWITALLAKEMLGLVGLKRICCTAALWGWSLALSSVHQQCQPITVDGPKVIMALKPFPVGQLVTAPFFWWECDGNAFPCQFDLKARDQSQAHLITSMRSGSLHHYNSERNFGFPLDHGVFLWL